MEGGWVEETFYATLATDYTGLKLFGCFTHSTILTLYQNLQKSFLINWKLLYTNLLNKSS